MTDDARIAADCRAELDWDPALDAGAVAVTVARGVVTLDGRVAGWPERAAAARAVGRLRGVRGVVSRLAVHLSDAGRPSDDEIARRVHALLGWRHRPLADVVQVSVADGRVTLTGMVDRQADRIAAERLVGGLDGVTAVENAVALRPGPASDDVRRDIRRALRRQAALQAATISVTTVGHTVVLTGRAHALADRDAAERTAWAAPGVTAVEVHIEVGSDSPPGTGA